MNGLTYKTCRHCKRPVTCRAGRGLCRPCWDDKAVREQYDVVAPFGGPVQRIIRVVREYADSQDSQR